MTVRRTRRSLRLLVPAAMTAAVVLVPSAAFADTDDPLDPVTGAATQVLDPAGDPSGGTGGAGAADTPTLPIDPSAGLPDLGLPRPPIGLPGDTGTPDPSTSLTPDELRQLFIQGLSGAGISADCVNGVFDGFEGVIAALTTQGQADLENLLDALIAGLTDPTGFDPSELGNGALANALKGLAATLQDECMPTPPGGGTGGGGPVVHPPTDGYGYDEGYQPHDNNGGYGDQAPTAPAPAAVAPVAAPGAYLGYAPTGGDPDEASSPVPLAALGGFVLLSAAGAATYRVSTRGARSRG